MESDPGQGGQAGGFSPCTPVRRCNCQVCRPSLPRIFVLRVVMLIGIIAKARNGRLLRFRSEEGLTQKEAAEMCGVSYSAWNAVETMHFASGVSMMTVEKIASVLGCLPADIYPPELKGSNVFLDRMIYRNAEPRALVSSSVQLLRLPDPKTVEQRSIDPLDLKDWTDSALKHLTDRERLVLELKHGIGRHHGKTHTLLEIGRILNITRERVRQILCIGQRHLHEMVSNGLLSHPFDSEADNAPFEGSAE